MASVAKRPPEPTGGFQVRIFETLDGTVVGFVASADSQTEAAELAEGLLLPGQHARIYDARGTEVGRVYPGD